MQAKTKYALSGTAAGLVNGLFGGGGGMVLVPLLNGWCGLAGKQAFATCVGTSRMRDELYPVMEERMRAFHEDH